MDEHTISPAGDPFHAAPYDQDECPHACNDGWVRCPGPLSLEAMNEERWSIRVRWHPYDQGPARVEWLQLPPEIARASISRRSEWISSYLREREGLPPDSHKPSERVLWFEFDSLRPTDQVPKDL